MTCVTENAEAASNSTFQIINYFLYSNLKMLKKVCSPTLFKWQLHGSWVCGNSFQCSFFPLNFFLNEMLLAELIKKKD